MLRQIICNDFLFSFLFIFLTVYFLIIPSGEWVFRCSLLFFRCIIILFKLWCRVSDTVVRHNASLVCWSLLFFISINISLCSVVGFFILETGEVKYKNFWISTIISIYFVIVGFVFKLPQCNNSFLTAIRF